MPAGKSSRPASGTRLFALIAVAGITAPAACADTAAATVVARINPQCELVADVQTDESPACWRLQCSGKAAREIGCDLTALHQIADISAAGDQQSLAVLSVGEGHPILEIVPLPALIERGTYVAQCTINPYPGNVSGAEWRTDHWRVDSDANLLLEGIEERADSMTAGNYRFDLNTPDCKLAPTVDH